MTAREMMIEQNMKSKWKYLKDHGYKVVAMFLQGSQNYGLDIYDSEYKSDVDVKAIVLPTFHDVCINKQPVSTTIVLDNNEHIEVKDIRVMKEMFIKQNISYIELLYTKFKIIEEEYKEFIEQLLSMRDEISKINENALIRCFKGTSMEKMKALEHPYPNLIEKINKYGYDPKQLYHIVRLNEFADRYLNKNIPLSECYESANKEELIKIKKGFYNLYEARNMAQHYNSLTIQICNQHLTENDNVNKETINKMTNIMISMLEYSFRKEFFVNETC